MTYRAVLLPMLLASSASAATLAGSWDEGSGFSLELVQTRGVVCGQVTSISGNRVDASWVIGLLDRERTVVEFDSGFRKGPGRGKATIRRAKGGTTL